MNSSISPLPGHVLTRKMLRSARLLLLATLSAAPVLAAQQSDGPTTSGSQNLQSLLQRIADLEAKVRKLDELEARVRQLEAQNQSQQDKQFLSDKESSATLAAAPAVQDPIPEAANKGSLIPTSRTDPSVGVVPIGSGDSSLSKRKQETSPSTNHMSGLSATVQKEADSEEAPVPQRMDVSETLMRIRGFGDMSLIGGNQQASPNLNIPAQTTTFALGQLDLFVTSDISDKFHFLSELIIEAGPDAIYGVQRGVPNAFKIEPERYLLQYSYNDHLNISVGRWHTAIGYYNTAYHHSTWFQTATGRPFLFAFEDEGGILPTHTVGISATGLIPSGSLGLHYVVEAGNGRASRTPLLSEPVQNQVDEENRKAYNLAVFARPEALRGLQTGFSVYRDVLAPLNFARVDETILAGHLVLVRPKYEWLNEALVIRHALVGSPKIYNTPGFYTQVARQFGAFRPYFRYQYVNVARTEPIFPDVGLQYGPSAGIRFDASESVALKFQYDYTFQRHAPDTQPGYSTLTLQVGFTF
jgi:hypothetical protein